jgi:endonuclease/exonuclease/phosphatase family metal-dependent hydrolase
VKGALRLVSWNLAYGKPAAYKTVENRRRQWALLGALAPDIALLQECRPPDLEDHAPRWMVREYRCVGLLQPRWRLSTSMLIREPLTVDALEPTPLGATEQRWLEHLSGCVATATVSAGVVKFAVASVHAAGAVKVGTAVTLAEHERIRRPGLALATTSDLLAAVLEPWVAARRFLVGGDWNTSPLFDNDYPNTKWGRAKASTEFFERRKRAGWYDAMRRFHDGEIRTYLDPRTGPREIDRVFTDSETYNELVGCHVLDDVAVTELSDHAPLVVDIAI